ncbi:MAG TPA: hypothetical protein VF017_15355 [Thermoanaerobaculia bacterium]|nr:hypothetical protein [Thermoanaerobaculia bacterium]
MTLERWILAGLLALAIGISVGISFGEWIAAWWWRLRHPKGRAW